MTTLIARANSVSISQAFELDWMILTPPPYAGPPRGLAPPALDDSVHLTRCLAQLRSKDKPIEKYIYLSQLKDADPRTFYRLCSTHMVELTPLIYTPTVGDACLQFSHIYRRPEGLVCFP
jgi:malate dehydrogenase (oxaloacetate-decarboxylating)(NADP+)